MRNQFLISLALGAVSAVVFASATTGPVFVRYVLFLLTSLPIFLAGLGWGWRSGALAGIAAVLLVFLMAGPLPAGVFGISQVLPAVVLCYLAMLSRAYQPDGAPEATTEWYPPGRLVLWSAVMAGSLALVVIAATGQDFDTLKSGLKEYIGKALKDGLPPMEGRPPLDDAQIAAMTDLAVAVMPAASAISWMTALVFNLWLAGRITLASGQLQRPWPDLSAMDYPPGTALMLIASMLASGAAGLAGGVGTAFLGAFFVAYVLLGLAVIHYVTRAKTWRPFALWALYAVLLVINVWIAVLVALVGLADRPLSLRQRAFPSGPPPPPGPVMPGG